MKSSRSVLLIIILSQFFCTSLWFAGNGVMEDIIQTFALDEQALGHLTSIVQFGFIIGTLSFAILSIADRYSPSRVFAICALMGALSNACIIWFGQGLTSILSFRFLTGFMLAGIYPVGMKIAADYFDKGLGQSLGLLVGALVMGTALPHLLREVGQGLPWEYIIGFTSVLASTGGLLMIVLVPDGPYRKAGQKLQLSAFLKVFQNKEFRAAAFGYFGHMWELYAMWAFVPYMLQTFQLSHSENNINVSLLSFLIIGVGSLACFIAGRLSIKKESKNIAITALSLSSICCLGYPLVFSLGSAVAFICFLMFWGLVVIADSPMFSTLVAHNAPAELKGTALTIVNCIGFTITILSIQLINGLTSMTTSNSIFLILAIGPILGLIALMKSHTKMTTS